MRPSLQLGRSQIRPCLSQATDTTYCAPCEFTKPSYDLQNSQYAAGLCTWPGALCLAQPPPGAGTTVGSGRLALRIGAGFRVGLVQVEGGMPRCICGRWTNIELEKEPFGLLSAAPNQARK
jgi:hypothetical protein